MNKENILSRIIFLPLFWSGKIYECVFGFVYCTVRSMRKNHVETFLVTFGFSFILFAEERAHDHGAASRVSLLENCLAEAINKNNSTSLFTGIRTRRPTSSTPK
jgi:hypothetical protein